MALDLARFVEKAEMHPDLKGRDHVFLIVAANRELRAGKLVEAAAAFERAANACLAAGLPLLASRCRESVTSLRRKIAHGAVR
jgi:hypothetical protein